MGVMKGVKMSEQVKRYDPEAIETRGSSRVMAVMTEDAQGDWVRGEDYDALHAEAEALRVALLEIASVNPAERGIEWAKAYASDGLKGAGSDLYARWLEAFREAEALRAENAKLRTALAKQGERQEAVVYAVHANGAQVDHHCPLVSPDMAADYLPGCATPLYTTPQPGPDVRSLAEALEWYEQQAAGCRKLTSEGDECRQALYSDGGKRAQIAIAAHRQAQPQ